MKKHKPHWPDGYAEQDGCLYGPDKDGTPTPYTFTPLRVQAMVRAADHKNWSYLVEVIDSDGNCHHVCIPTREVVCGGREVIRKLADIGLAVFPGCENNILTFLMMCRPEHRKMIVRVSGWADEHDVFVLPGQVIGRNEDEIIFEPEEDSATQIAIRPQGSLEEWQTHVAKKSKGNPLVIFVLLVGLLGPMLRVFRLDGGGAHLWGKSSRGKTTLLQIAASIWGNGGDPGSPGQKPFTCRWNLTTNAIEVIGKIHNDLLIALDELGTFVGKDLGQTIYVLAGGQGKSAMNSARKLQKVRTFRGNILSTGEIPVEQKVRETGKRVMAGQLLRLIDIPVGDSIFTNTYGLSAGDFAVGLKKACASYFGTAGPAFVTELVSALAEDRDHVLEVLHEALEAYATELTPASLHPEQGRVIRRLAALRVTGELAIQFGILPLDDEDVAQAVTFVRDLWLQGQNSIADVDRAIRALRSFLLRNHSAFANVNDPYARVNNAKGFFSPTRDAYLLTDEQLEFAGGGHDPRSLARELRLKGFLSTEEGGRLKVGLKIAAMKNRKVRLYSVRAAILEADLGDENESIHLPVEAETI